MGQDEVSPIRGPLVPWWGHRAGTDDTGDGTTGPLKGDGPPVHSRGFAACGLGLAGGVRRGLGAWWAGVAAGAPAVAYSVDALLAYDYNCITPPASAMVRADGCDVFVREL